LIFFNRETKKIILLAEEAIDNWLDQFGKYDLFFNNCQHFATSIRYLDLKGGKSPDFEIAATITISLLIGAALIYIYSSKQNTEEQNNRTEQSQGNACDTNKRKNNGVESAKSKK